jgi:membrane protein
MPLAGLKSRATETWARLRRARPSVDHLARAGGRYKEDLGDRLADSVAYRGFLSIFPLLLLGLSVLGFVLHSDPEKQAEIVKSVTSFLPGIGKELTDNLRAVSEHRTATGVIGLVGLAFAGLGWIDALRESLRLIWHQPKPVYNLLTRKVADLGILVGLGLTVVVSLGLAALGGALSHRVLAVMGLGDTFAGRMTVTVITVLLSVAADTALFLFLFLKLPRVAEPWQRVVRGALFGAVVLNILKFVGTFYITRTVAHASQLYGTFGLVIGLLIWVNLVSRGMLFAAAWTVTEEYADDVAPSGTADPDDGIPSNEDEPPATPQAIADERASDVDRDASVGREVPAYPDEVEPEPGAVPVGAALIGAAAGAAAVEGIRRLRR